MSDTEGPDDGGFDKEAEREKLREKYERDEQRREATQQMSELLLKGATMTNQHCDDCGSPIFRMDGEEFCPNCGTARAATGSEDATGESPEGEAAEAAGDGTAPGPAASGPAGSGPTDGETTPDETAAAGGPRSAVADPGRRETPTPTRRTGEPSAAGGLGGGRERAAAPRGPETVDRAIEERPTLEQARASLRRAIVSLSEQAAQSDEPKRARELLQGAREASEALSALGEVVE